MFTQDAGATWETQVINNFGTDGCFFRLSATDINHAWAVGYGGLFKLDLGTVDVKNESSEDKIIRLYPNPATDIVHVYTENEVEKIQLVNISGQIVFEQKKMGRETDLDISVFESGIYFVKVFSNNNVITRKLVIE